MSYIAHPISKLDPQFSSNFNASNISNLLLEVIVDDYGNEVYSNKKATFASFGDFLISSHPIFNKIDEIYNDKTIVDQDSQTGETIYKYRADIYLAGITYFNSNPYVYRGDKTYYNLKSNQTVQKRQFEEYIHDNSLEIDPISANYTCVYASQNGNNTNWIQVPASRCPYMTEDLKSIVPFFTVDDDSKNTFTISPYEYIGDGKLAGTAPITFNNKNRFVTVIGKVKIPFNLTEPTTTNAYYTPEINLWAAAYDETRINGRVSRGVIAITELHNYKNNIAYFSLQFPISVNQKIRIVLPFLPAAATKEEIKKDNLSYDIFKSIPINAVCLYYYSNPT